MTIQMILKDVRENIGNENDQSDLELLHATIENNLEYVVNADLVDSSESLDEEVERCIKLMREVQVIRAYFAGIATQRP